MHGTQGSKGMLVGERVYVVQTGAHPYGGLAVRAARARCASASVRQRSRPCWAGGRAEEQPRGM